MTILLEKELCLTTADNEKYICVDLCLSKDYDALEVICDYSPKWLSDEKEARRLIEAGMELYKIDQQTTDWKKFLPVGNMITISLDYEGTLMGAAHRHHPKQRLVLSEQWSTPGFLRRKACAGNWRVVVCSNAIVSAQVICHLSVRGLSEHECLPYKCMELHTHTMHSDGGASVEQLCRHALEWGYDGVALTDHNTWSGVEDLTPDLEAKTLPAAHGIEWTTLYGHFLVIGGNMRVDCRFIQRDDIDTYLAHIQDSGASIGVAHPCDAGAPFCNGCDWRFLVERWELVDYIEIWNGQTPMIKSNSRCAFLKWTKLLNQGYRLGVSSGGDWHLLADEPECPHLGVTYLAIDGPISTGSVAEALKAGRSYVTAGPMLDFFIERDECRYVLGDEISSGMAAVYAKVDTSVRRQYWSDYDIKPRRLELASASGVLASVSLEQEELLLQSIDLPKGWVRLEMYGAFRDVQDCLLGVTSPIYVG